MLLKKLESFFLLLTFGLFLFSCTVEEKKEVEKPRESTECKVSIEISGANSLESCRFEFSGTYGGSPIYIPETTGFGNQELVLGASGDLLEIAVRAYSLESEDLIAEGSASKEILKGIESTNFEIKLTSSFVGDFIYLTLNDNGNTSRLAYKKNELVGDYTEPKKDGYSFAGWFSEPNGKGEKLNSNYTMSSDITFYAYWIASNDNTEYTVVFETRGGSSVPPETRPVNSTIDKPADPTKPDCSFTGWFTDAGKLVSFPYTVIGNTTLYAGWVSSGSIVNVTGVTLGKSTLDIEINKTTTLNHFITPTDATNKGVSWSSSNSSVVTVNNGEVTGVAGGTATITVKTDDGGFTATCTVTVSATPIDKTLSAVILTESAASTEEIPAFTATAKYSDRKTEDVTSKADWESTNTSIATISGGIATLVAAGSTEVTASYTVDGVTKESNKATVTVKSVGGSSDSIYLIPGCWDEASAKFAAYFWDGDGATNETVDLTLDSATGYYVCTPSKKWANAIFKRLSPTGSKEAWDNGAGLWNKTTDLTVPADSNTYEISGWDSGSWNGINGSTNGGTLTATVDVETPTIPEKPTVNMNPAASGEISLKGNIVVDYVENNASVTAASVTISGAVSKTYSLPDFSGKKISISVERLGLTDGTTITVIAEATNSEGTTSVGPLTFTVKDVPPPPPPSTDTFTWDNVNAYFVLTDRFANGNSANDHSYSRKNGLSGDENVATFHGGDIKGLTDNMDYFKKLGINAIWITAPYEQAHGWVGGKNGKFPHYAFHGYYTLDWTFMDQNMGTIDEFRAFVQACHENGIRVIMDVVMNHVGYNNTQDMITYGHGKTSHGDGWLEKTNGEWNANDTVVWDHNLWETWWGPWARSFAYEGGSEYGGSCGGLPDVRSEVADTNIGVAPVLKIKWEKEDNASYDKWRVPAVANVDWWGKSGNWRTNQTARIVEYQCVWLSAWVREFGIDGFRCDTAKHVEPQYWGMLKDACTAALEAWRKDSSKVDNSGAKNWDEAFWMTGECWGWTSTGGGGEYYQTGKFDSMINFSFNGGNNWDGNYRTGYPQPSSWDSYININKNGDSDGNGHRDNVLSYISSHDTGLTRVGEQYEVGTGLVLLPGGVQIFYGDESYREKAYLGCGDGDMFTRGDMNLSEAKSSPLTAHWGKVGNFRKYNPAVGAGTGSGTKRTYNDSKVAIGISGTSVDVSGLFNDGETVYNWYDGKSAVVSGGKVTFDGGSMKQPILVSDRNPADYGVTF